ncbi:putative disease resistance protein [Rosa sericea]
MASSSHTASASLPSSARCWEYDVFLSFRGVDTRKGITFELYDRLQNKRGIKTFIDDKDLQAGAVISPTLLTAIEESRLAIVVLSQNYASSTWCLEELAKICQCMKDENRILPLFYHVEPTDIRYQKRSFEQAFTKHENSNRHGSEKVQEWRDALAQVANYSGWHTQNYKTERELADAIVDFVCSIVQPVGIIMGDFEAFEATREAMDKVKKALKEDEVSTVGVYGMGGVGKTTMVKHVGDQARKNGIFHHVIMAVMSQSPDLTEIQHTLAELLGIDLQGKSQSGRASRLNKEIMRKNKILIILDDIWERIELSSIGIPKELQKCNSKVLLTTRIQNVCHAMECQEKITLNVLSEEDSWTLFMRNARRSFETTIFRDIARKVARECCGLPIALIAVARALGDKDLREWKKAAQRLNNSQTANLDDKGDAFQCIKLSYDYLKDEDCKSCFLVCSLFPEDYDIPIEDLFRYAIGKGVFRDADTIEEARETLHMVVTYLKNSSLLLDSGKELCVRMHDVIRDTTMKIALSEDGHGFFVKAGCGLEDWPRQLQAGYSAVSLMGNEIRTLPEELVCPKLQVLLLQDNCHIEKFPEAFFQSSNELRVLNLSNTCILLLPQSFSLLANLQVLHLDDLKIITDISMLGKLKKLEILSMRESHIGEFPKEIGDLTNLRMLDLTGGHIVTIPSKVFSKLHKLEELYMQCGFWDWGSEVEGGGGETNAGFDELTSLPYLRVLKVWISHANCIPKNVELNPNWVEFDICIGRDDETVVSQYCYNSVCLTLDTAISTLPDWFVFVVINKAEKLEWVECKGLIDFCVEYEHRRLDRLKYLSIIGCDENLKELMNTTTWVPKEPVFENLEDLHLSRVDFMKELCLGDLPQGSLFSLKLLEVDSCYNWGNILLPSKLLQRVPNLETLICNDVDGMEYVFGCEGFEPEKSKLIDLSLRSLDAVRSICNGPAPPAMFQALKVVSIEQCSFVGSLFSYEVAQCLYQLEDLSVGSCPLLERVIEANKETMNKKKTVFPKLKNLVLMRLPMLYSGSATIDFECPLLECLYLKDCSQFSSSTSASDFHSRKNVQFNDEQHYLSLRERMWGDA